MGRKLTFVALCVLTLSGNALSRELDIGHLETADDPDGLNWLFFHCNQSGPVLDCDVFQTLINHELAASERDKQIEEMIREDPGSELCNKGKPIDKNKFTEKVAEGRNAIVASAEIGMKPDGRPTSADEMQDSLKVFDAWVNVCLKPSPDSVVIWPRLSSITRFEHV